MSANTINELSRVLAITAKGMNGETCKCAACGDSTDLAKMSNAIEECEGDIHLFWVCPTCAPEAQRTNGATLRLGRLLPNALVEETLIAAAEWLDAELLTMRKRQPFVRRLLLAEEKMALAAGKTIPEGAAVVVAQHDATHLSRQLLPFPFPWHDDAEWIAGPQAAREALATADEVKRGNVDVQCLFGVNALMIATPDAVDRIVKAGRAK